jgi:hypothetical protein
MSQESPSKATLGAYWRECQFRPLKAPSPTKHYILGALRENSLTQKLN